MIVGAHAVFVHGMPRFSLDLDVALAVRTEMRDEVRAALEGPELVDFEWVVDEWGSRYRCLDRTGSPIEFFFSAQTDLHVREYERRVYRTVDGVRIPFISPEDLVLRKLVNTRMRRGSDFDDAVGVLRIQGASFDVKYVRRRCAVHRVCSLFERARALAGEGDDS